MKGLYVLKEKRIYKRELPLWGSLLAAVWLAGCITLLALWCQPNALRTVLAGFKAQPLLIVFERPPHWTIAAGLRLPVPECLLQRGAGEFLRLRTVPCQPGQN